jgi:hypothetical protein
MDGIVVGVEVPLSVASTRHLPHEVVIHPCPVVVVIGQDFDDKMLDCGVLYLIMFTRMLLIELYFGQPSCNDSILNSRSDFHTCLPPTFFDIIAHLLLQDFLLDNNA